MHRRDIEKNPKMKYTQLVDCTTYTNISIHTPLYYAQTYQYKHRPNAVEME